MVYSTVESTLPYVRNQFCLCWPLSVLTLGCRYICSRKWTGGTLTCGLWSIQKAFKLLLTWLDWIYWDCSSPSLFFFFHPWLIRHHLCSFQAVRKTEGVRGNLLIFLFLCFLKRKLKCLESTTPWQLVQMQVHLVLFSLRTELWCCLHCGWKVDRGSLQALMSDCESTECWWSCDQRTGTGCPCCVLGSLCCDMLSTKHFQEALCGDVQVTIHFSNSSCCLCYIWLYSCNSWQTSRHDSLKILIFSS